MTVSYDLNSKKKKDFKQAASLVSKMTYYIYIFCFIPHSKELITQHLVGYLERLLKVHKTTSVYEANFKSSQGSVGKATGLVRCWHIEFG